MAADKRGVSGCAETFPTEPVESKNEKRRRLLLSDSDSDEPSVSVCEKTDHDDGLCQNDDKSFGGTDVCVRRIEEKVHAEEQQKKTKEEDVQIERDDIFEVDEKHKLVVLNKRFMGSDVMNCKKADTNDKETGLTELEEKREIKSLDIELPQQRIHTDLYKHEGEGGGRIYSKQPRMGSSRNQGVIEDINSETPGGSKVSTCNRKGRRKKMSSEETYSDSNQTNITSTEIVEWTERSGIVPNKLKDQSSGLYEKSNTDTGICKIKGNVLRVQGKSGVLKFSPRKKKVGGMEILHATGAEKRTGTPVFSRISDGGASEQPSFSEDRNAHQKLVPDGSLGKNIPKRVISLSGNDELKLKATCKVSSPGDSKRLDMSDSEPDVEDSINNNLKTSVLKKQKVNEGHEASSTAKQKIRDRIKSILLNAGWKIDLRPRKGRNYLDSVYIPPEGKGSYWSITKAYAVYQDQLNDGHTDKISPSGMPSSSSTGTNSNFDVGSSSSVIPTESINMLKRVVVNKRRRAEELEDAESDQRRKIKISIRKPQLKKFKVDETRQTKKSNIRLVSKINDTAASRVHKHLQTGRNKQKGYALLARGANKEAKSSDDGYILYDGKRTVLAWLIDLGVVHENGKVRYMNSKRTKSKLEGWITNDGIFCSCCSKTLTLEKFELHAGSKLQQASENIYTEDEGISLLQCQLTAWEKQSESERRGFYTIDITDDDPNDDTCGICGDGGDLICCDGCPSTFHLGCLGMEMLPSGDWNCTNCSCKFCGAVSSAAVDDIDGTFPPLLSCSQCEEKYHTNCVPEIEHVSTCSNSSSSFCSQGCREISKQLQKLIGVKNNLEAGFSWTVIRRFGDDFFSSDLSQRVECNSKIAVAFAVMDECFEPIIDQRSGISLIHNVVYNCGSNFNRLDYRGFYTFILERGDEIISVASVRIHGTKLAEMPFIGTRNIYRRQGMCRRLLDGIETALRSLNVEKLVIPAISELKHTWTTIFGFKPFEVSQELEVRSINMLVFPGTGLLLKPLVEKNPAEPYAAADIVAEVEGGIKQHENKILECMPSKIADKPCTLYHLHVVPSVAEPVDKLKGQVEQTVEFLCEAKANVDHEVTSTNNSSIMKLPNADDEFIKYGADVKCVFEDGFASNSQESGDQSVCQVFEEPTGDINCGVKDIVSDDETKQVVNRGPSESLCSQGTHFLGKSSCSPACSPVTKKCHIAGHKYLQTSVLPALSEPVTHSNGRDTSQ